MANDYNIKFRFSHLQPFRVSKEYEVVPEIDIMYPPGVSNPSIDYVWKLDDVPIGTSATLSYVFTIIGNRKLSLEINYFNAAPLYQRTIVHSQNVTIYLDNRDDKIFIFENAIQMKSQQRRLADLYEMQSAMPSWSSAASNIHSNYSKAFSPIYERIGSTSVITDKMNIASLGEEEFGYISKKYYQDELMSPVIMKVDNNFYQHAGEYPLGCIEDFPIRGLRLSVIAPIRKYLIDINQGSQIIDKSFEVPCNLFLELKEDLDSTQDLKVSIIGEDTEFNIINEDIVFTSYEAHRTSNRFKRIIQVISTTDARLSNYLDGLDTSISFESRKLKPKKIGVNGVQSIPSFSSDQNILNINNDLHPRGYSYESYYLSSPSVDKLIVNSLLDVIALSGTSIYAGKIMQDIRSQSYVNGSYNNNIYITSDCNYHNGDQEIVFTIDVAELYNSLEASRIRIELKTNDSSIWINKNGVQVDDKDTTRLADCNSKITFSIQAEHNESYVMSIYVDQCLTPFSSGSAYQHIEMHKLLDDVQDFFYFSNSLIVKKDNNYYISEPIRYAYETGNGRISIDNDAQEVIAYYERT